MRLYIVRHAKAERDSSTGRDEDRPLNTRGERQAQWLGDTIARLPAGDRPGTILASPAVRARETAKIIQRHLECELRFDEALRLGASIESAIQLVEQLVERAATVMIVGHNPTLEILVEALTGEADSEMRTGEAAVIDAPTGAAGGLEGRCRLIGRMRSPE